MVILFPAALLLLSSLLACVSTQSCHTSRYTQPNFSLKGHVNKTLPGITSSEICIAKCRGHPTCHSINFYNSQSTCEVNDANHLTNPESLVPSCDAEYSNYHERPPDKCSPRLCSDKHLCEIVDKDIENPYRCCGPGEIVLHFPRISKEDYVVFEKPFVQNLAAFTISMWLQIATNFDEGHSNSALSYAINDDIPNELFVGLFMKRVDLSLGNVYMPETVKQSYLDNKWHHVCLTWDRSSQRYYFYVDTNLLFENIQSTVNQITGGGALVLGQDQDKYIGGFQLEDSFMGNMSNINMWDRNMNSSEVKDLYNACAVNQEGNVLKWSDLYTKKRYGKVGLICANSCG